MKDMHSVWGKWQLLALIMMTACVAVQAKSVVVFRYDGYSGKPTDEIALGAFVAHKLPVTVAVVPYAKYDGKTPSGPLNADADRVKPLREAVTEGVATPALHSLAIDDPNVYYTRLSYEEELAKLQRGTTDLQAWLGQKVDTLVPPENRVDAAALRAAYDAGIRLISGGPGAASHEALVYLPACYPGLIPVEAIRAAAAYPEENLVVVTLRPSDIAEGNAPREGQLDAKGLGEYLDAVASVPGVEILPMAEATTKHPELVSAARQTAQFRGLQVLHAGKLYAGIRRSLWKNRPEDVAWEQKVWEPLASKRYLPHAMLGLLSLALISWLWEVGRRIPFVRMSLLVIPLLSIAGLWAATLSRENGVGLNLQAAIVAAVVAFGYSAARYTDMVARQVKYLKGSSPASGSTSRRGVVSRDKGPSSERRKRG